MADAAPITPVVAFQSALAAYEATAFMRQVVHEDDDVEAVEVLVRPFYGRMVEARTGSLDDVRLKLAAIMSESGGGLIEVEDVALVARDIDLLLGRASQ